MKMKYLLILILFLFVVFLWIMLFDSTRFVVRNYKIEDSRIRKNCRAVLLTDLHNKQYGRNNALLLEKIREANPDFIFVAGDMLNGIPKKSFQVAVDLLTELAKEYPVYYANGNHEHRLELYPQTYGDMAKEYEEALEKIGIKRLVNASVDLEEYGIRITGSQIDRLYYKRFKKQPMDENYLEQLLGEADEEAYQILLAHNPAYFENYAAWGADLSLAGHVHGGIVRIPFLNKGVLSPSIQLFPKYDGGIYSIEKKTMLVSCGLGSHTIPFRLFNPGELWVLDFETGD